jgi:hypothetical protein
VAQELLLMNGKKRGKRSGNPRGIPYSGCLARPGRKKGRGRRLVRVACGYTPLVFLSLRRMKRRDKIRLMKACLTGRIRRRCEKRRRKSRR